MVREVAAEHQDEHIAYITARGEENRAVRRPILLVYLDKIAPLVQLMLVSPHIWTTYAPIVYFITS